MATTSIRGILEHLEGASNKARFHIFSKVVAGAQAYAAGESLRECFKQDKDIIAIRAIQGHTVSTPTYRRILGWERIPAADAENMVLYHGMRGEHIRHIAVVGLLLEELGAGEKAQRLTSRRRSRGRTTTPSPASEGRSTQSS